jgi:glutamyl-tRNA reductase
MEIVKTTKQNSFFVIGLNYKKADATLRGKFSLNDFSVNQLLQQAKEEKIESLMVVSTCNRTEIFGFANHPNQLIKLLCDNTEGTIEDFEQISYTYKGNEAIHHIFVVGTGLDSQILGDFEIIAQLKYAFNLSKKHNLANAFLERLINSTIQASKRVKNETEISSGATSVSFAAVQYIIKNVEDIGSKNILLFGTGKIGRNTCENLVKHTKNDHIVLVNRTKDKAEKVAGKFNLIVKEYINLQVELQNADVVIVATGAQKPTVDKEILALKKPLLILDLSVPKNVHENVTHLPEVTLIHMDYLSQMTDETLEKRKQFIPRAMEIIDEVKEEFIIWKKDRKYAPTIQALKAKLNEIKALEIKQLKDKNIHFNEEQAAILSKKTIQKITAHFVNHLKKENSNPEESFLWINKRFDIENSANLFNFQSIVSHEKV